MGNDWDYHRSISFLKEQDKSIQIIGVQPTEGSRIPGIRRWKAEYVPEIFKDAKVDKIIDISQEDAENSMVYLSQKMVSLLESQQELMFILLKKLLIMSQDSIIVTILCDRGDRYLSKI